MVTLVRVAVVMLHAAYKLDSVDDGSSGEGHFSEGDDGDEDAHESREGAGVARRAKNARSYRVADVVPEHENAGGSGRGVKEGLGRVRILARRRVERRRRWAGGRLQ